MQLWLKYSGNIRYDIQINDILTAVQFFIQVQRK